jgi:hypothetical protein
MAHTKYYAKDGEQVPSVTTVIGGNLGWNKNMLIAWTKKKALKEGIDSDTIVKESSEIGTLTHYLCENKIKNTVPDITPYSKEHLTRAKNGYLGFCDWEKFWKPTKYTHCELSLVSEKYRFAGTIDILAERDGGIHLLDLKTSNHIHPEMVIQLAAYKRLYEEVYNVPILSQSIIKLCKDEPRYDFYPVNDAQDLAGWEVFLQLLEVNKRKKLLETFGK